VPFSANHAYGTTITIQSLLAIQNSNGVSHNLLRIELLSEEILSENAQRMQ
jgi:hypothetical protein